MSEFEYSTLIYGLFRDMDGQIQFWMQATFAVVVAVFFAGDNLSQGIRRIVASLYLTASAIALFRWILTLRRTIAYRTDLVDSGYSDIPTDWGLVFPVTILLLLMFLGGVIGTMYFLARPSIGRE